MAEPNNIRYISLSSTLSTRSSRILAPRSNWLDSVFYKLLAVKNLIMKPVCCVKMISINIAAPFCSVFVKSKNCRDNLCKQNCETCIKLDLRSTMSSPRTGICLWLGYILGQPKVPFRTGLGCVWLNHIRLPHVLDLAFHIAIFNFWSYI